MKLFLILITFFTFSVGAQESKLNFWENIYLEINANLSLTSYFSLSTNSENASHNYIQQKAIWGTSDVGLHYRNNFFNGGINVHTINNFHYQLSLGGNALQFVKNSTTYFGPLLTFGKQFGENKLYFNEYIGIGIETYVKHLHMSFCYQFFHANNVMRGLNIQVGSAISLSKNNLIENPRFLKNLFIEGNGGIGKVEYSQFDNYTATSGYVSAYQKAIIPLAELSINYRTNKLKIGSFYTLQKSIGAVVGLNIHSALRKTYLGPFVGCGYFLGKDRFYDSKKFTQFGIEMYLRNFHLSVDYSMYYDYLTNLDQISNLQGINLKFGYAVPFSFDKKKK